jgi:hypothetical protein
MLKIVEEPRLLNFQHHVLYYYRYSLLLPVLPPKVPVPGTTGYQYGCSMVPVAHENTY